GEAKSLVAKRCRIWLGRLGKGDFPSLPGTNPTSCRHSPGFFDCVPTHLRPLGTPLRMTADGSQLVSAPPTSVKQVDIFNTAAKGGLTPHGAAVTVLTHNA